MKVHECSTGAAAKPSNPTSLGMNMTHAIRRFFLKGALLLCLAGSGMLPPATTLRAGTLLPLSVQDLASSSELIVNGRVTSKACLRDEEGRIYTRIEVAVDDVWKGTWAKEKPLVIVHGGGSLEGRHSVVSNQVSYHEGEEMVAFLRFNNRGEAVTIALRQGKFDVSVDKANGQRYVQNVFHGGPPPSDGSTKARLPFQLPLSLAALRAQVQTSSR